MELLYSSLVAETLEKMNSDKLESNEAKVFISDRLLSNNLAAMKVLGKHNKNQYANFISPDFNLFKSINSVQKGLIKYLKIKYPRNEPSFVPEELRKMFKNFDTTERAENDIMCNFGFCFSNLGRK